MNAMGKPIVDRGEENGKRVNNCEEEVDPDSLADDLEEDEEEGSKLEHRLETDAEVENEVAGVFANDEVRRFFFGIKTFI